MIKEKQIQIPETLFVQMIQYFLGGKQENFDPIVSGINAKLDKAIEHDLFTKSKVAATLEEREKARQEYLDRKGIPASFRWGADYGKND